MKVGNMTVYRNVFRREDDGAPHYRGKITIREDGIEKTYELAIWINDDIQGVPINLSGQVTTDD